MPKDIPDGINRAHIQEAIKQFDAGVQHLFADSTVYDLLFGGRRYPPKAIVGIAARILTGKQFEPKDFKGGQQSKCFRVLQTNGFQIALKSGSTAKNTWIFQGNPKIFDIDDYLSRYSYVYWRVPRYRSELCIGDPCLIWRSGKMAGAVAIGRIAEAPQLMADVNFPECLGEDLWRTEPDSPDTIKVGIELDEVRLDEEAGFLPRIMFVENDILSKASIITSPQGTVFKLQEIIASEVFSLWNTPVDLSPEALPTALEGSQRLRKHYSRERNRQLIGVKKRVFADAHAGLIYCEVCGFDFSKSYPPSLGNDFIEVHHLTPLSVRDQPKRTTLDDLLLVCSNCHRMIHRSTDVERNLLTLREHFS